MSETGNIRDNPSEWFKRGIRRITWMLLAPSLLIGTGEASTVEITNEVLPATTLGSDLTLMVVGDTELNTMYGKGYERPVLRTDERLSVILWDEGKRKVRSSGTGMSVVTYSSDGCRRCAEWPR